ncbi:MAG: membrane protein insertase YidC [Flavobacteriales bacterium]
MSVELKNYQTNDSLPLRLFHKDSSSYGLEFSYRNRILKTDSLHFKAIGSSFEVRGQEADSIRLRTPTTEDGRFIEFVYKLKGSSYQVDHKVHIKGLDREMNEDPTLHWSYKNLSTEKSMSGQQRISTVCYKYQGGESSYLTQQGKGSIKNLVTTVEWVSFKQRFFSSILISDRGFGTYNANLQVEDLNSERYVSHYKANLTLPFDNAGNKSFPMSFFFGPNKYELLASYERNFEGTMNLGWGIIGWINEYLIIPIFGMLDESGLNYGIVILILTLIIKTILFPLTYKSFLSGAKQRVLKPEIDALQEKYKGSDDQMKQQQEMMALYKKSGVNPMAGCLPMFIQLPILIAMYRFFPTSIELRQEPFLWASDLSSYDSILSLPFNIPFYGDHVSLFTLLMFASTMIYTKLSSSQMGGGGNQQMPQMKVMMYIFPIFILFIFNSWPAGLSYYYFTANVISICQMLIVKHWIIDEDELKRKIEENKKKPQKEKKASKFQKRLEDMAKQKGYKPPNK